MIEINKIHCGDCLELINKLENDIILDLFSHFGITSFNAKKTKRKYIGIEINKEYVHIANKRLQQEVFM